MNWDLHPRNLTESLQIFSEDVSIHTRTNDHAFDGPPCRALGSFSRRIELKPISGDDLASFQIRIFRRGHRPAQTTFHDSHLVAFLTVLDWIPVSTFVGHPRHPTFHLETVCSGPDKVTRMKAAMHAVGLISGRQV